MSNVRNRYLPSLYGVGYLGEATVMDGCGRLSKEYVIWSKMLERCYCSKYLARKPTYDGCTVSDNFKNFTFFKNWCNKQVGFGEKYFSLDKDILLKGNKLYSEDTCAFIPRELNNLLTLRKASRGNLPIGVTPSRSNILKYTAKVTIFGKGVVLGDFNTPTEAFYAYKVAKEEHIKCLAKSYEKILDARVVNALINYEVSIED